MGQQLKYPQRMLAGAAQVRELQDIMGYPSTQTMLEMVDRNLLLTCPVTRADLQVAENVYGPNLGALKGKTVRRAPVAVDTGISLVPPEILSRLTLPLPQISSMSIRYPFSSPSHIILNLGPLLT
jgi:hypothetical protein